MSYTYENLVFTLKDELKEISSIPSRELQILIESLTKKDKMYYIKNPNEEIPEAIVLKIYNFIKKRQKGYPLEYMIDKKEFYGLNFYVDSAVLIPRPETEMLVDEAFKFLKPKEDISILDLGTGSGCIAVSLAHLLKYKGSKCKIIATDKSFKAIKIARRNATTNKVKSQIKFIESNWFENINEKYDCIISNPPYVKKLDKEKFPNLIFEPEDALYSGDDGLTDIKYLLDNVQNFLNDDGLFLCEFGYDEKGDIEKYIKEKTKFTKYEFLNDLAGIPRVLKILF